MLIIILIYKLSFISFYYFHVHSHTKDLAKQRVIKFKDHSRIKWIVYYLWVQYVHRSHCYSISRIEILANTTDQYRPVWLRHPLWMCTYHTGTTNMTWALMFIVFIVSRFCNSWTLSGHAPAGGTSKMDFMCRNAPCCVVWNLTTVSLWPFLFVHAERSCSLRSPFVVAVTVTVKRNLKISNVVKKDKFCFLWRWKVIVSYSCCSEREVTWY